MDKNHPMSAGLLTPLIVHGAVFLVMLGLFVLIAYFMPIDIEARTVFFFLPPFFILYLGGFALIRWFYRKAPTRRRAK